jgi:hypothetical protein
VNRMVPHVPTNRYVMRRVFAYRLSFATNTEVLPGKITPWWTANSVLYASMTSVVFLGATGQRHPGEIQACGPLLRAAEP